MKFLRKYLDQKDKKQKYKPIEAKDRDATEGSTCSEHSMNLIREITKIKARTTTRKVIKRRPEARKGYNKPWISNHKDIIQRESKLEKSIKETKKQIRRFLEKRKKILQKNRSECRKLLESKETTTTKKREKKHYRNKAK